MKRVLTWGVVVMFAFQAGAQNMRLQSGRTAGAGASYESWKAGDDRVASFSIPISFIYPINDKVRLYALSSPAFSNLSMGGEASLGGMSDIKFGGHALMFNDQWLLTFGLNLPSGRSVLDDEEYLVSSVMALPAFNFRVPVLGQGFDVQIGFSGARDLGGAMVGWGVGFLMKGPFQPFESTDSYYNPGDEITATLGFSSGAVTGDIIYTYYLEDEWLDQRVFKSGGSLSLQLLGRFPVGANQVLIFLREKIKGKNKISGEDALETETKNSNINQFELRNDWLFPAGVGGHVKGIVDLILYANNEYGTGGATLLGVGGGGDFYLYKNMVFKGEALYYFGRIQSLTGKLDAAGVKVFGGFEILL